MFTDIEEIILLSQGQMRIHDRPYRRLQFRHSPFKARFTIFLGPRGVGKTTAMIQYLKHVAGGESQEPDSLYVPADHIGLKSWSLYTIGEHFALRGGRWICFDEIHKVPDWSRELKSLYDTFPELVILATGSSALEISKGGHELSRRAHVHYIHGLSFREYLELRYGLALSPLSLSEILDEHVHRAEAILKTVRASGRRILPLFQEYLRIGYFPFFTETPDESVYLTLLEQNVRAILESDILAVNPTFTGAAVRRMSQLLSVVASSVPFKPDFRALRRLLEIGDERTLKNYLRIMETAGLLLSLTAAGKGLKTMEKPEKIYLGNTNLIYALSQGRAEKGNVRETFFLSQLAPHCQISAPRKGDFLINGRMTFEVGGRNKTRSQIKNIADAYLAIDDLERGTGRRIPLWLFGFLY